MVLARSGARVALIDKAPAGRDKACGDLVGPRGVALLTSMGLDPGPGRKVSDMIVVGPTGNTVVLPAPAGTTYPGHGVAIPRRRFDRWLRECALDAGAQAIVGTVRAVASSTDGPMVVSLADGTDVPGDLLVWVRWPR